MVVDGATFRIERVAQIYIYIKYYNIDAMFAWIMALDRAALRLEKNRACKKNISRHEFRARLRT